MKEIYENQNCEDLLRVIYPYKPVLYQLNDYEQKTLIRGLTREFNKLGSTDEVRLSIDILTQIAEKNRNGNRYRR